MPPPRPGPERRPMATWLHSSTVTSLRFLTRGLLVWPVTPNQITVVSTIVGLAGALRLATVSYTARLAGTLALLASSVLDGVDGELARARREQSPFGARLDLAGDDAVNLAAFVDLGHRAGPARAPAARPLGGPKRHLGPAPRHRRPRAVRCDACRRVSQDGTSDRQTCRCRRREVEVCRPFSLYSEVALADRSAVLRRAV